MNLKFENIQEDNQSININQKSWQDSNSSNNNITETDNNPMPNTKRPKEFIPKVSDEEMKSKIAWRNSPEFQQGLLDILPKEEYTVNENGIDYDEIDWTSINSDVLQIQKGKKMSIYKIAQKKGWPMDANTHSHIILQIRALAKQNNLVKIVDKNYIQAVENTTLSIPNFRAYANHCKNHDAPKFRLFFEEKLQQYDYPPLITNLEQEIIRTTIKYNNPVTGVVAPTSISETLYGKWLLHRISTAKNFYDRYGSMKGFEYSVLEGQPEPVNSELIVDSEYGWYSQKAWKNLKWKEKVGHFDRGLDQRLQKNEGNIRQHYKEMKQKVMANDTEQDKTSSELLPNIYDPTFDANGKEIYSTREQIINNWKEDGTSNTSSIKQRINNINIKLANLKDKLQFITQEEILPPENKTKTSSNETLPTLKEKEQEIKSKISAYLGQKVTYEKISLIIEKWENQNYTPTKEDVEQLKEHKEALKKITIRFYAPSLPNIIQIENDIIRKLGMIDEASIDNKLKIKNKELLHQYGGRLIQVKQIISLRVNKGIVPSFEDFEQIRNIIPLSQEAEKLGIYELKLNAIKSPILIETHNEKYGNSKSNIPPPAIQKLLKNKKKLK